MIRLTDAQIAAFLKAAHGPASVPIPPDVDLRPWWEHRIYDVLPELLAKRRELRAALAVVRSHGLHAEYDARLKAMRAKAAEGSGHGDGRGGPGR